MWEGFDSRLTQQAARTHRGLRVVLADIKTFSGSTYYVASLAGNYAAVIGSGSVAYKEWIKSLGVIALHRSTQVDVASLVLQNLTGNSVRRDVMSAFQADEFWGALAYIRLIDAMSQRVIIAFQGRLGKPAPTNSEISFGVKQTYDGNLVQMPAGTYQTLCDLNFKGNRCGSTGSATTCDFALTTCKDASHNSLHRFTGVPTPPPITQLPATTVAANDALGRAPMRGGGYLGL